MWMASILPVLAIAAADPAAPLAASAAPPPIYWRQDLFSIPFRVERRSSRPRTGPGSIVRIARPGRALGQLAASQPGKAAIFSLQGGLGRRVLVRCPHTRPLGPTPSARPALAQADRDRRYASPQGPAYGPPWRCGTGHGRFSHRRTLSQVGKPGHRISHGSHGRLAVGSRRTEGRPQQQRGAQGRGHVVSPGCVGNHGSSSSRERHGRQSGRMPHASRAWRGTRKPGRGRFHIVRGYRRETRNGFAGFRNTGFAGNSSLVGLGNDDAVAGGHRPGGQRGAAAWPPVGQNALAGREPPAC